MTASERALRLRRRRISVVTRVHFVLRLGDVPRCGAYVKDRHGCLVRLTSSRKGARKWDSYGIALRAALDLLPVVCRVVRVNVSRASNATGSR